MTTTKPFREQRKLFTQSVTLCEVSFAEGIGRFYRRPIQMALLRKNEPRKEVTGRSRSVLGRDESWMGGGVWDPEYAENTQIGTVLNSQGRLLLV